MQFIRVLKKSFNDMLIAQSHVQSFTLVRADHWMRKVSVAREMHHFVLCDAILMD